VIAVCGKQPSAKARFYPSRHVGSGDFTDFVVLARKPATYLKFVADVKVENFLRERKKGRPKAELKTILGEVCRNVWRKA